MPKTSAPRGRTRPIQVLFCMNEHEKSILDKKLETSKFSSMGAFIRKMLLTGYIVKLDLEPIRQLVSLTSNCSNNLNQLARRANSYEAITNEDMEAIKKLIKDLHDTNKLLLNKIGSL